MPCAQKIHKEVASELHRQHLRDHIQVGDEGALQDNRDVGGVEELDGVAGVLASVPSRLDGQVHPEALEVDDNAKDEHCGAKVHQVGQILAVESLTQGTHLVLSCCEKVEECNDGSLKLGAAASVDGGGAESLPDDGLADVGGDEEGDPAAEAVTLLKQLVQEQHNETGHKQLDDDQQTDTSADVTWVPVHSSQHVHNCLSDCDDHAKELLGAVEESPVLGSVSLLNQLGARKQLHDQSGGDDGGDAELHEGSSVRSKDNSDPVEGVRRV